MSNSKEIIESEDPKKEQFFRTLDHNIRAQILTWQRHPGWPFIFELIHKPKFGPHVAWLAEYIQQRGITRVEFINLEGCNISDEGFETFWNMVLSIPGIKIESISFKGNPITIKGIKAFMAMLVKNGNYCEGEGEGKDFIISNIDLSGIEMSRKDIDECHDMFCSYINNKAESAHTDDELYNEWGNRRADILKAQTPHFEFMEFDPDWDYQELYS